MVKNYKQVNNTLSVLVLFISFFVYFDTMAPSVSYWDCGEFIAVANTLGVPHPPGSPLFLLIGRIASILPLSKDIAFRVNIISPLVSSFAVFFLYLSIVKIVVNWRGKVKSSRDCLIVFGAGLVGSLTFAFTDSHWFNAVEAEVYAFSTFFTAIVVWLILLWSDKANEKGHERYILIIAYMIGLATGLHLLNLLTLPFIALVIYFRKYEFEWVSFGLTMFITGATFFIIHNIIIKGIPKIAASIGVGLTGVLILSVFSSMIWSVKKKKKLLSVATTSLVLVLIGYSTYALIFIRSNQDPGIDENDPETIEAFISYLEREQYGSVGTFPRRFKGIPPIHQVVGYPEGSNREFSSSQKREYSRYQIDKQLDYFWNYQIRKMYNRYFLWQFAGRGAASEPGVIKMGANNNEDGVDLTQFGLPLAFILGIIGMFYHAYRDDKMAFSVMTLFVMTGYAIIIYLNQDNPQPRERDYSYVGSFFAFAIWVGIGTAAIGEWITNYIKNKELSKRVLQIALILQLICLPVTMASVNYHSHDRSGNFVAWDYSYNILQSCLPNGVIFTNGDNDTFPLWYLQEVEKLRTDVAVVNLSLLNTHWYIKQWRDKRKGERRIINLNDNQIDRLTSSLQKWEKQNVMVPVNNDPINEDGFIEWEMKPTFQGQALRVQDMMIMHIINESAWRSPIYFAVTVSQQNRIGLEDYLAMQGLAFRLKSHKTSAVDTEVMYANLMTDIGPKSWSNDFKSKSFYLDSPDKKVSGNYVNWSKDFQAGYMFRNLGNETVYYNKQTKRLLQNYRSAYVQLAFTYYMEYQRLIAKKDDKNNEKIDSLRVRIISALDKMEEKIPNITIPIQSEELHFQVARMYGDLGERDSMRKILEKLISLETGKPRNRIDYANTIYREFKEVDRAIKMLEEMRTKFIKIENMVQVRGFNDNTVHQGQFSRWQKAYPDIVSSLIYIYRENDRLNEAEMVLSDWISKNPKDDNARDLLNKIRNDG